MKDTQCPKCAEEGRDSNHDNLRIFDDGGAYCTAGHGYVRNSRTTNGELRVSQEKTSKLKSGIYSDITSRKLTKETCKFYDYQVNFEEKLHIANFHDEAGNVKMQKIRYPDKKFSVVGDKSYTQELWGLDRFTANENVFITITEGEIDCLSVAQVFDCKYPVVSLPLGVSSAADVLQNNMYKLDKFKYIILAFDNDKPGKEATEECIKLFEPGKVRIAHWVTKDANEMLQEGKTKELRDVIYNATEFLPSPLLTGDQLINCFHEYKFETKDWPWKSAKALIQPVRIPAVYTIAAKPKIGKTEFVAEIVRQTIGNGENIGIISLEQTIQQSMIKLINGLSGKSLDEIDKECLEQFSKNIVIYDHIHHGSNIDQIVKTIPYMVKALNCKYIIFDNISFSITTSGNDERMAIDQAMAALKNLTVKYNFTLFNVCHIKRSNNPMFDNDEDEMPNIEMIRGSQGIEMYSDIIIGLHRNTSNTSTKNILTAYVLADRLTGQDTGKSWKMKFDPKTRLLGDCI